MIHMKIADFTKVVTGGTPSTKVKEYWESGNIPWLQSGCCQNCDVNKSQKFITKKGYDNSNAKLMPPNTVMIALTGATAGKIGYLKFEACGNQSITGIFPCNTVNQRYLYYYLLSQRNKILSDCIGGAQPHISQEYVKNIIVPIRPLEQQERIAKMLSKIEKIINARKDELKKIDELIKARFVEMFGDQKNNPFRWEQCTIGECCTLKSGTSLASEIENEGGPVPYIKVGDMNYPGNERYITTSSRYVSEATAGKGLFEIGSILFPKRGGAIGTNKKRMTKLPVCADLNVMGVSSKGRLRPEYLLAYFDMIDLGALSDGSSVPQINNKNIAPLVICLPPLELQEQFATFVKQVDKSKFTLEEAFYIESQALELLKEKVNQDECLKKADKAAVKVVNQIFAKAIYNVDSNYNVDIKFY